MQEVLSALCRREQELEGARGIAHRITVPYYGRAVLQLLVTSGSLSPSATGNKPCPGDLAVSGPSFLPSGDLQLCLEFLPPSEACPWDPGASTPGSAGTCWDMGSPGAGIPPPATSVGLGGTSRVLGVLGGGRTMGGPPRCVLVSPNGGHGGPRGLMDKASDFGSED